MSTWKKVALDSDIAVFAGGSDDTLLGGTTNDILLVGANGQFSYLTPGSNTIIVGENGAADNYTFAADGDINVTFDASANDITLNIDTGAVDTAELASGAVKLSKIADSDFDDETTGVELTGAMLYWNGDDNASLLGTGGSGNQGYVLTVNASGLPEWTAATATDTIDILNGETGTSDYGVLFGSEASIGGLTADKVYTDSTSAAVYNLSYAPAVSGVSHLSPTLGVLATSPVGTTASAGLYSKHGFAGDLAGTSTSSKHIVTHGQTSGTYYVAMVPNGTSSANGAELSTNKGVSYSVNSDGDVDVTISGNLIVNGNATKVEIESQEVQIADFRILLAHSDADGNASGSGTTLNSDQVQNAAGGILGVGVLIDNANETAERNLAGISYNGWNTLGGSSSSYYTNSKSVLGWTISQEVDNTASSNATRAGVGVMHVESGYTMTQAGGTNNINIGIGAMGWFGTSGLWIQTAE